MCRIVAGTILEIGVGKRSAADIPKLLEARDRYLLGVCCYSQAGAPVATLFTDPLHRVSVQSCTVSV
jgi:hypothetical protein